MQPEGWLSEPARVVYVVVSVSTLVPIALMGRPKVAAAAGLTMAAVVVHQHTVGINVPDMWPHLLNGIVLVRMGLSAFNGDGGPFLIKWTSGALATTAFLAIIVGTCLNVGLEAFKQKMHVLIYSLGALLCISGTCDGVLRARLASDETLARMRSARSLHDPTVAMCIGLLCCISTCTTRSRLRSTFTASSPK